VLIVVPASLQVKWQTEMRFDGHRAIYKHAEPFLARAQRQGIRHAFFAIDNDGGKLRRPEHAPQRCNPSPAADIVIDINDDEACRFCWLRCAVPVSWVEQGGLLCLAVPVQTIETWLLHLRGEPLTPSPEQVYDRAALKKCLFGKPLPPAAERIAQALAQLQPDGALDRLRQRESFRSLESQLVAWR
jgi:hypothetical protein